MNPQVNTGFRYTTGLVSRHLIKKGYRFSCCDLYFEGLEFARIRGSGEEYFECNLLEFPLFIEFDVIFACDVLEHIAEDTNALSQLFEALKHG
ncbi:methyltransferase domain-containing protein [Methanospirillum sp.]|uniref:class I SAM-dependent methyltransferase n=1 Tax=Methanospirillum sp. TaxID=45200 RepID=UPI001BD30BAC